MKQHSVQIMKGTHIYNKNNNLTIVIRHKKNLYRHNTGTGLS